MKTLISLFSGGGGIDLGLEAAGFESRYCLDFDAASVATLVNMKQKALNGLRGGLARAAIVHEDIQKMTAEDILSLSGLNPGEADLLAGGPPCQSWSLIGKRGGLEDPRGHLIYDYLRILRGVKPKVFIFENVPGLLSSNEGKSFASFLEEIETPSEDGSYYCARHYVLDAANYGVPQHRKRIIVIGVRQGIGLPPLPSSPPPITHAKPSSREVMGWGAQPFNTTWDALESIPAFGALNNHAPREHDADSISRFGALKYGERDKPSRLNRNDPNRPAYTVRGASEKGGGQTHVHPFEPRTLTPREAARLQSFPDWWEFSGAKREVIKQIGNAVPPILAAAIGSFVLENIFGETPITVEEIWRKLGQEHLVNYPCL